MYMKEKALELYSGNRFIRAFIKNYLFCGIPLGELVVSLATESYKKMYVICKRLRHYFNLNVIQYLLIL